MWSGGAASLGVPAWQEVVLKEESYNLELVVWRASSQSRWTGYPILRRGKTAFPYAYRILFLICMSIRNAFISH